MKTAEKSKSSFFVVSTPYHILNSIKQAEGYENSTLVVLPSFDQVENLLVELECYSKFDEVKVVQEYLDRKEGSDRPFRDLINPFRTSIIQEDKKIIDKLGELITFPTDLYVFHDGMRPVQFLLSQNSSKGGCNTYIEDGAIVYSPFNSKGAGIMRDIIGKIYLGAWYNSRVDHGTYNYLDEVRVFFPELVERELEGKINGMNHERLKDIQFNHSSSEKEGMLFIAPLKKEIAGNKAFDGFIHLLEDISSQYRLNVKYHPRETSDYLENFDTTISRQKPSEIVIKENDFTKVIGYGSTALYTATMISNSEVIDLSIIFDGDVWKKKIFDRCGVEMPENVEEFKELIDKLD